MSPDQSTYRVLGRTWHFTPSAIAALQSKDPDPVTVLRQLAYAFTIVPGLEFGITYKMPVRGQMLQVTVARNDATIDGPANEAVLH